MRTVAATGGTHGRRAVGRPRYGALAASFPSRKDLALRLAHERSARLAEDERLVCLARAEILLRSRQRHAGLSRVGRQAATMRDLCAGIPIVIGAADVLVGRMPEVVPDADGERWVAAHPELFCEPGDPGRLDSLSIYAPDWGRLLERGLGGIAGEALAVRNEAGVPASEREFLDATVDAVTSVSSLIQRYAAEARRLAGNLRSGTRRRELEAIAERCDHVAWDAPGSFIEALQLLQIVHMVLACLIGGRDVTPARLDQYLWRFYRDDLARASLTREQAVVLLALFMLRLSQMAGNATDSDDNVRRSPCRYSHLYVTVGGRDAGGRSMVNDLSRVVAEAVRVLAYKEPTLLVRHHVGVPADFAAAVTTLARDRFPVTIYNDETVIPALLRQGVPAGLAHDYAHSACHNALIPGREAGSGPAFHNLPRLILETMAEAPEPSSFDAFWERLEGRLRQLLTAARCATEASWASRYAEACPLLASALMPACIQRRRPAWQAATVSHWNHHLLGLATAVDSLLAIERIVSRERLLGLGEFCALLARDWEGAEGLRRRLRTQWPRYGQGNAEADAMTARLGLAWVAAVESVSAGMDRLALWPGFYSHMLHLPQGRQTPATPDGRLAHEPLSENLAPSAGTPRCRPTDLLRSMAALPLDRTPSGAAVLSLSPWDLDDGSGRDLLLPLMESYFRLGGLHLQVNVIDPAVLRAALTAPGDYPELMVRVTGFSAYFARLSPEVQQDLIGRHSREL